MKKTLKKYIALNPHGNNLKSSQTIFWLISVCIVIFLIAISEGFIWGNLFNFYFKENLSSSNRIPLCVGIGLIVFLLLWIIDTSFVLLDTSISPNDQETKWYKSPEKIKTGAGFILRLLVVAISLYTTIPAITKLSVSDDIDKFVANNNLKQRAKLINETNQKFKLSIDSILNSIGQRKKELLAEVGGTGVSKRYGDKVVANVIRTQIREDSVLLENTIKDKDSILNFIQNASSDSLTARYGVVFMTKTAGMINDIAKTLSSNESYKQVEKVSRVYVILLFVALTLLKVFAPRSVKIYLNEELQDLYIAFKKNQINSKYFANFKGEFDNRDGDITPYRFHEFWKYYYAKSRLEDYNNLANNDELNSLDIKISKLNQQKADLESELSPCERDMIAETEKLLHLEQERSNIQIEIDKTNARVEEIQATIDQIKQSKGDVRPEDLITLSKQQTEHIKERNILNNTLNEIKVKISTKNKEIGIKEESVKRINKQLTSIYANFDTLITLKKELRDKYMEGFSR